MPDADPILAEHKTLGPYTLTKKLGEGGMGGVYLGKHNVLQVEHAIKIIRPRMAADPQLVERFLREARHAARLIHPNIVQVLAADVADGLYYLAMQFVQGQSLAEAVAKGKLTPHRAVRYIHMACLGLHYAHRKQIIHRDIKPGNLLIDDEDNVKITDFGLVRDMTADDTGQNNLTQTGLIIGTPHFMPPEQWHGEGVDLRSDIYAMGVTLYHLLTRSYPYPGRTPPQILGLLMQGKPEPLKKFAPNVDDDLSVIVLKAMASDMAARYQTAAEFAADLDKWWAAHPPTEAEQMALNTAGTEGGGTKMVAPTQLKAGSTLWSSTPTRAVAPSASAATAAVSASPTLESSAPATPGVGVSGAVPTPTLPQQVTIIQQGSKTGLVVGLTLVALVALALGVYAVFGSKQAQGGANTMAANTTPEPKPSPEFTLALSANEATEANPLFTDVASYVIDGRANVPVMLDGKPYKLGEPVLLKAGKQTLEITAQVGAEKFSRKFCVVLDADAPTLAVPLFDKAQSGELPTEAANLRISGSVSDLDEKTVVTARVNGLSVPEFPVGKNGDFEFSVQIGDSNANVEIQAQDRLGHKSRALQLVVVPDRAASTVSWFNTMEGRLIWSTTKQTTVNGKLSKVKGRKLFLGKEEIKLADDGGFSVTRTLEEGTHTLVFELKDWLGRESKPEINIKVDLFEPRFSDIKPAPKQVFMVEKLPAEIVVSGIVDDESARITCAQEGEFSAGGGKFTLKVKVEREQEFSFKVLARDGAGRDGEQLIEFSVKLLRYRALPKNPQGCMEYERLSDGMVFIAVPAAKFKQGIKDDLPDAPLRDVNMGAFLIAKFETTNAQFAAFLNKAGYTDATVFSRDIVAKDPEGGTWSLKFDGTTWSSDVPTRPVVGVTYNGARAYCRWADETSDLPSEAQWEYAARGTDGRAYPWGNATPSIGRAAFAEGGTGGMTAVGTCKDGVSTFGVMDCAGNVEEWCLDWYDVAGYTKMLMDNPVVSEKPQTSERRVVRGGSFLSSATSAAKPTSEDAPSDLRVYQRGRALPQSGAKDRGFRAAAKMPK
jgi:serine/threonine protein kinase/formylglycine-generating enzyme required for sulfatase activity